MQSDPDIGVKLEVLDEGQVGLAINLIDHRIKIADRLMGVYEKYEMKLGHDSLRRTGTNTLCRVTGTGRPLQQRGRTNQCSAKMP